MFDRIQLKENAKKILKKNYWWAVLVALILTIVAGGGGGINFGSTPSRVHDAGGHSNNSIYDYDYDDDYEYDYDDDDDIDDLEDMLEDGYNPYGNSMKNMDKMVEQFKNGIRTIPLSVIGVGVAIFFVIFMFIMVIVLLLRIFLFNSLSVGCYRWFIKNRAEKPSINEVVFAFSGGYKNVTLTMFLKDLYEFLWTLLFIIPGIVKAYEYRMIPYLLAENPGMDHREAFERSRELMKGNKWDAFVLDLSFLGWSILGACTCGILNIFYVSPYRAITNAELYIALCQGPQQYDESCKTILSGQNANENNNVEINNI